MVHFRVASTYPAAHTLRLIRATAAATAGLAASASFGQSVFDDFSTGNDSAWTRFDGNQTAFGIPTTFNASAGVYQISSPRVPNAGYLPIISSVRGDAVNTDGVISVDVLDWSGPTQFGLIARGQADFSYYAVYFTPVSVLAPNSSNFRIERNNWDSSIGNLVSTSIAGGAPFAQVDQTSEYRITLTQTGSLLHATLYNLTTSSLVTSLSVHDTSIHAITGPGVAGITMYSNDNTSTASLAPYSVTFDNFRVVPSPGAAALLGMGAIVVGRRRR